MNRKNYALGKMNFIMLAIGMAVVILGFVLMSGTGSSEEAFNPDIFSAQRIKVAPWISVIGFLSMIFAILYHPKKED